jgi:TonB family protein
MNIRPVIFIAVALCVLPLARLGAQDVLVGEPQWFMPEPAPEVMPKAKNRLRPDYPEDLRKAGEIGYVIITRYVDADGKSLSVRAQGTQAPFQRAVEAELRNWQMAAAQRAGQPVAARVWLPVIFNPKSSAVKGADATPRLLAVAPAVTKKRPDTTDGSSIVRMKLSLDATGAITSAEPVGEVKPPVLKGIQEALKAWKFAPARQAGQPIAAELVVPVVCMPPPVNLAKTTPPKIAKQVAPVYPAKLRYSGLRGEVVLEFEVDAAGKVKNPVVRNSNSPAFNEPAIEAVSRWTFQPAVRDGKPVSAKLQVPIVFEIAEGGRDAYKVEGGADQSKLPETLRYDTPAKIRGTLDPVYPYNLRRDNVRGRARAIMMIDLRGRVTEVSVVEADKPEFGLALAAALDGFSFDPALKNGRPVMHALSYEHRFGDFKTNDGAGDALISMEKKHPEKILGSSKLDGPLKPISRRAPVPPTAWPESVETGEALVELLIDKEGHVRLPRIVSATADCFGYAAVQSVAAWQFEPPLSGGKSVVVRAEVPFKFTRKEARDSSSTPASAETGSAK